MKRRVLALENSVLVISSAIFSLALVFLPGMLGESSGLVLPHADLIKRSGGIGLALTAAVELAYRWLSMKTEKVTVHTTSKSA